MEKRIKLIQVGETQYDFNYRKELAIYNYLCHSASKKEIKSLDEKEKFEIYKEWETYVKEKYYSYKTDELINFSHYLEQMIRTNKTDYIYWNISISAIMSVAISTIISILSDAVKIDTDLELNFSKVIETIVVIDVIFITIVICCAFIFWLVSSVFNQLNTLSKRKNLYIDYKNIIDEMITNK